MGKRELGAMKINKIIVHCSDSPQGRGDDAETIHKWHKERDFDGIGYHAVILENGTVQPGRPDYWTGAHAAGSNSGTLGVCLIGTDSFTPAQFKALRKWVNEKREKHRIKIENVIGHYETPNTYKTCPNFNMMEFRGTL